LALEGVDLRGVAEVVRLPLVRIAAEGTVEIFKAHAGGPLIEGPGLTRLERRGVVVLPEPGGVIAVVLENPPDRRLVAADEAIVAGIARRLLGYDAEAGGMMIAPGDERRARRRAQRRRVEIRVAQTVLSDAIERRRRDHPAKGACDSIARIIRHD